MRRKSGTAETVVACCYSRRRIVYCVPANPEFVSPEDGSSKVEDMTIDWAATGSMTQGIATLLGAGGVVWSTIHAGNVWKAQKRAERRLEIAERILTATHKARSALAYVRGVMMWGHELNAAEEKLKEDVGWQSQAESRRKRLVTAQAYYTRLNNVKDERNALLDCLPMARAMFGEYLEKSIEQMSRQFWIVQVNVDSYVDDEHGTDAKFTQKIRYGMYDITPMTNQKNEVSDAISNSVSKIESVCAPAILFEPNKSLFDSKFLHSKT